MKLKGCYFDRIVMTGDVIEATVSDSEISIDWDEGGDTVYFLGKSSDGVKYQGNYGIESPDPAMVMELRRFTSKDEILLVGTWKITSPGDQDGGAILFRLAPERAKSASPKSKSGGRSKGKK